MGTLEDQLRRKRFDASAKEIQRRHRLGQQEAARLAARMAENQETGPGGVHPVFARHLDAARERVRTFANREPSRADVDAQLDRLRREGKLPAVEGSDHVGYEPTPEEVLGDLAAPAEPSAPDGEEWAPDADEVLSSEPPERPLETPRVQQPTNEMLAQRPPVRHATGKRNRR